MAKQKSYEEMMKELENIVRLMEEDLSLESSMKNYENGIKIYHKMYKILNEAEGKIKIIKDKEEKDFLEKSE
ncbi:exodeoxyribonuclease VII small subunit [Haloimpatiens sp. FM7315]|uniref:exodeoxyribonuclease VII small subunit n=1 Tax=Haloimpatiens sp. FM7315 TaxID=3298609 RepID=UPI00370C2864